MKTSIGLSFALLVCFGGSALADTHYVDINSTIPFAPYTSWYTAATSIQAAVSAADSNDTVLVSDGTYVENVYANKDIFISSVNGPDATIVDGGGHGYGVFDLYGTETMVTGFTITNGYSWWQEGSGLLGGSASNCIITGNYNDWAGGGMAYGTAYDCTFIGNEVYGEGGGMYLGTAYDCTFIDNAAFGWSIDDDGAWAGKGGGMYGGTAYRCIFDSNKANAGGGMCGDYEYPFDHSASAYNCVFSNNSVRPQSYEWSNWGSSGSDAVGGLGGGMAGGNAYNCIFINNAANGMVCGMSDFNSVSWWPRGALGGGTAYGNVYNCTIVGNGINITGPYYDGLGKGIFSTDAYNSIIYYNTRGSGYSDWYLSDYSYVSSSCTDESYRSSDSIHDAPLFVDKGAGNYRLADHSPCINAGKNTYASSATDLDGNARIVFKIVDAGAYEWQDSGPRSTPCQEVLESWDYNGLANGTRLSRGLSSTTGIAWPDKSPFGIVSNQMQRWEATGAANECAFRSMSSSAYANATSGIYQLSYDVVSADFSHTAAIDGNAQLGYGIRDNSLTGEDRNGVVLLRYDGTGPANRFLLTVRTGTVVHQEMASGSSISNLHIRAVYDLDNAGSFGSFIGYFSIDGGPETALTNSLAAGFSLEYLRMHIQALNGGFLWQPGDVVTIDNIVFSKQIMKISPESYYAHWLMRHTGINSINPDDNFDDDAFDNLYEYAFGGDPADERDTGYPQSNDCVADGDSSYLEYVYMMRADAVDRGLWYFLELSTNLVSGSWKNEGYQITGSNAINDAFQTVTNRVPTLKEDQQFIRLQVEWVP